MLSLPILDFMGLMILRVGLFEKFCFWFLSILNASLLAVMSTLLLILSFVVMALFSLNKYFIYIGYFVYYI